MKTSPSKLLIFFMLLLLSCVALTAQVKKNPKPPVTTTTATPQITSTPTPTPQPGKKNERPAEVKKVITKAYTPVYFYSFVRPGFSFPEIYIEHDESGRGQISFKKDAYDDLWTDPLQLTPVTMANLKTAFAALNFIDSTEDYQYAAHDFSNMGNVTITLKQTGKQRIAKYNWTENKDARALMDEYRRISNEYTWKFELVTARQNQPLQTPGMMDALASYLTRNELTDPPHLVPFLTELATDERLPLMARNRALKLNQQIQKATKK